MNGTCAIALRAEGEEMRAFNMEEQQAGRGVGRISVARVCVWLMAVILAAAAAWLVNRWAGNVTVQGVFLMILSAGIGLAFGLHVGRRFLRARRSSVVAQDRLAADLPALPPHGLRQPGERMTLPNKTAGGAFDHKPACGWLRNVCGKQDG